MSKHRMCDAPVGLAKRPELNTWELPTCILVVEHDGAHVDKDGNLEYITIGKKRNSAAL